MEIKTYHSHHLVTAADLNHHGTLYAARTAQWFVEAGFIAAAKLTKPENIVCLKIHGMHFTKPILKGQVLCFESKVIMAGRTSLMAYIQVQDDDEIFLRGFITFIHVDADGKPISHGLVLKPLTPEDVTLQKEASTLR
jgi:acyl-CoA hydrolase